MKLREECREVVRQRDEGGGHGDGEEEMDSKHIEVVESTGLADRTWKVRDDPCVSDLRSQGDRPAVRNV